jgi:hypothetical protein
MTKEKELIKSISQATRLGNITDREALKKTNSGADASSLGRRGKGIGDGGRD